ncbi:MAG: glutamate racemase [Erysipelotrichaceae bacterium]|nr:glutamate racemase [Erysipelotrichaceae bacterium]
MNNKYIGVFDSGIGGLTVVKSIMKILPKENIIYFGDTLNSPYGDKKEEQIIELVKQDAKFLAQFDLKAIVIACNTADAIGKDTIMNMYDMPVFGVVDPASKYACSISKNKKIGVIATKAAINSKAYDEAIKRIDEEVELYSNACPLLVPLVEQGKFTDDCLETKQILEGYLKPLLEKDIDSLILGCTHYPLLENMVRQIAPNINIISSSDVAAKKLKEDLEKMNMMSDELIERKFYVSSDSNNFARLANIFIKDFDYKINLI